MNMIQHNNNSTVRCIHALVPRDGQYESDRLSTLVVTAHLQ